MKFATVLVCMFFVGICHADLDREKFRECLQKRYSIAGEEVLPSLLKILNGKAPIYFCDCDPSTDKYCVAPNHCVKDSTPDDLLDKYKDCGLYATFKATKLLEEGPKDGEIGGLCELWRYCHGEARCENYKCVPHACKKEGEIPSGPDDKCCMPMVTHKGEPCKLLDTNHNSATCNSNRKCQLDHEGRHYVCCYINGLDKDPRCVLNNECPTFHLYSQHF